MKLNRGDRIRVLYCDKGVGRRGRIVVIRRGNRNKACTECSRAIGYECLYGYLCPGYLCLACVELMAARMASRESSDGEVEG